MFLGFCESVHGQHTTPPPPDSVSPEVNLVRQNASGGISSFRETNRTSLRFCEFSTNCYLGTTPLAPVCPIVSTPRQDSIESSPSGCGDANISDSVSEIHHNGGSSFYPEVSLPLTLLPSSTYKLSDQFPNPQAHGWQAVVHPYTSCRTKVEELGETVMRVSFVMSTHGSNFSVPWMLAPTEGACRTLSTENFPDLMLTRQTTSQAWNTTTVEQNKIIEEVDCQLREAINLAPRTSSLARLERPVSDFNGTSGAYVFTCEVLSNYSKPPAVALVSHGSNATCASQCEVMIAQLTTLDWFSLQAYSPATGPTAGGTVVTLQGTGFAHSMWCKFTDVSTNASMRVAVEVASESLASCISPPGAVGSHLVQLVTPLVVCPYELNFTYYKNPQVQHVEPKFVPRFGGWTINVQINNYEVLHERGTSLDPKCRLVTAEGDVLAYLEANFSRIAQGTVLCKLDEGLEPLPHGVFQIQISLNGQQYEGSELAATSSVTVVGPKISMISQREVVSKDAKYVAIGVELSAVDHGLNLADVHATINVSDVTLVGAYKSTMFVTNSVNSSFDGMRSQLESNTTLTWRAGKLGVQYVLLQMGNSTIEGVAQAFTASILQVTNAEIDNNLLSTEILVETEALPPLFSTVVHMPVHRTEDSQVLIPVDRVEGESQQQAVVAYSVYNLTEVPDGSLWLSQGVLVWERDDSRTKYIPIYICWDRIPLVAEYPIGISLEAVVNARVTNTMEETNQAVILFGVPEGSCPPGSVRYNATQSTDGESMPSIFPSPPHTPAMPPVTTNSSPGADTESNDLSSQFQEQESSRLGSLLFQDNLGSILDLQPEFEPEKYLYRIDIPSNSTSLDIIAETIGTPSITIECQYNEYFASDTMVPGIPWTLSVRRSNGGILQLVVIALKGEDNITQASYSIQLYSHSSQSSVHFSSSRESGDIGGLVHAFVDTVPPFPSQPFPAPPPFYNELSPFNQPQCQVCPQGFVSNAMDSLKCDPCPIGSAAPSIRSQECSICVAGQYAARLGSTKCSVCPVGTFSPNNSSRLCLLCPQGFTSPADGLSECSTVVDEDRIRRIYAVLVEFNVMLGMNITGKFSWEALPELVGLNATGEALIAQLIRMDTADAFSISANNVLVNVLGIREDIWAFFPSADETKRQSNTTEPLPDHLRRAMLLDANVSAILEATVPPDATKTEVAAAIAEKEVSADKVIQMLSDNPDKFFERTTTTLGAKASAGNVTSAVITPQQRSDNSEFFDDEANIAGLAAGIAGGVLTSVLFFQRIRKYFVRRRLTIHASMYGVHHSESAIGVFADDCGGNLMSTTFSQTFRRSKIHEEVL
eukprot:CAMPEP_0114263504 /NCGR_PEP_ID=MMETSP0058-20121206/22553_1 /TAXON_ID=36894 /ORGANISM="Pyramimonas parkeae, CCMP726" /LENGTH=1328 /DNA_ID=CAMNT_0001379805 /DNA_START=417 /DNA_END=4403 /DNA_ORIENTATION=+